MRKARARRERVVIGDKGSNRAIPERAHADGWPGTAEGYVHDAQARMPGRTLTTVGSAMNPTPGQADTQADSLEGRIPLADRVLRQLGDAEELELLHDRPAVRLDGLRADLQLERR